MITKQIALTLVTALVFAAVCAPQGKPIALGSAMPAETVSMISTDDKPMTLANARGKTGTLVIFTCNHCPYVKAWQDRMTAIANDAVKSGVGVAFINANDASVYPEDDHAHMKSLAKEKGYRFPYLIDGTSAVAIAFGASRTPEAFLFDAKGSLVYHGAVDDSVHAPAKVNHHYLKDAIASLISGKKIALPETKSVGCSIKFHGSER
ncbi:MAG: thioredoxin family protein [Spirochaetota bacterium]